MDSELVSTDNLGELDGVKVKNSKFVDITLV
jgi:hypothetical protein